MINEQNLALHASRWNLKNSILLEKTLLGHVYKVQHKEQPAVLKLYTDEGIKDERGATEFLNICKGYGVVNVLESDDNALLMEYCDGDKLETLVAKEEDSKATEIIVNILRKIHTCPIPKNHTLTDLKERFKNLFIKAEQERKTSSNSLFIQVADIAEKLLSSQEDICLLHGDIHHANIMHDSQKGWIAIDPKGFIGDRVYDIANLFLNPWEMPEIVRNKERFLQQAKLASELMGVDLQKIINYAFVEAGLSAAWFIECGMHSEHAENMMRIIHPFTQQNSFR